MSDKGASTGTAVVSAANDSKSNNGIDKGELESRGDGRATAAPVQPTRMGKEKGKPMSEPPTKRVAVHQTNSGTVTTARVMGTSGSSKGSLESDEVDPFMTVIYPNAAADKAERDGGDGEGSDTVDKIMSRRDGDNFDRTQVRVGGYMQGAEDNMAFLIPNDLPQSTFLYLLTASDGRDRLFKCMQCCLHLLICLLKRPSILPQGSEESADYWAERFRKNINTIRHGRSLFKLGRWIVNAFFLQEVYERLSLKYDRTLRGVRDELKAFLSRCLSFPPGSVIGRLIGWSDYGSGGGGGQFVTRKSLVLDDTYEHVARAELCCRPAPTLHSPDTKSVASGLGLEGSQPHDTSPDVKEFRPQDFGVPAVVNVPARWLQGDQDATRGVHALAGAQVPINVKDVILCDPLHEDVNTLGSLPPSATPPSLYPATTGPDAAGISNPARSAPMKGCTLLRPIRSDGGDDESTNSNNTSNVHNTNTAPSSMYGGSLNVSLMQMGKPKSKSYNEGLSVSKTVDDSHGSYTRRYPTLAYEPKLGGALCLPHQNNGDDTGRVCRSQHPRTEFVPDGGAVDSGVNIEAEGKMLRPNASCDESDYCPDSSGTNVSADEKDESEGDYLAADMGKPVNRRKGILHFSTPLMLLQAVRSLATIARRLLRDLLLLSTEHFFNFSRVERNRSLLQRCCHWLWLVVASIDVFLNTIRLLNPGWYKYTTVRDNPNFRCGCKDPDTKGSVVLYRDFVTRRQKNLYFPDVDLDFGVPICSSPGYFEAADPVNIAPACRACGKLFVEAQSRDDAKVKPKQGSDETAGHAGRANFSEGSAADERDDASGGEVTAKTITGRAEVVFLFVPWLMRRLFNCVWLVRSHSNWSATIWLQVSYLAELYLAVMYCIGGYDTGKRDAPLEAMINPTGAIVGFVGAVIGVCRVIQSAPK